MLVSTHQYNSLRHFCIERHVMLPKPTETWRLVKDQPVGEVVGLPTMRGVAVATNGILVAIEFTNGRVEFGHLDWFKTDKQCNELTNRANAVKVVDNKTFDDLMADFSL